VDAPSGADGGKGCQLSASSNHNTFVGMTFVDAKLNMLNSTNTELYDHTWSGSFGSFSGNTGDWIEASNQSNDGKMVRCTYPTGTKAGHSCGIIGNLFEGATTVSGWYVFDCSFQNVISGGLQILGKATDTTVEWCTFTNVGTDLTYPNVGSRAALQNAAPNTIFRFNTIYLCEKGVEVLSYLFAGVAQTSINGYYHHNTITQVVRIPFHMQVQHDLDAATVLTGNVMENNIIWGNNTHALVGNESIDQGWGYFNGKWNLLYCDLYNTNQPWASNTFGGNTWRNNLLGRSSTDSTDARYCIVVRNVSPNNQYYTLAQFESNFTGCANNIAIGTDPLFISSNDFHLQSGSPAINAGYIITTPAAVTYSGSAPDLGVYEYGGAD
jgi:hypothetical protein